MNHTRRPTRARRAASPGARGAFSLLELTLAMAISSGALLLAGGIFFTVNRVDESSERTQRVRVESYMVQTVLRNTFMSILVVHGNAQDTENPPDVSELGRPRIILQPDAATGSEMQRLEIVLRSTPVPGVLQGPAARRAFLDEDAESLNFASADGAGGSARCVFELRRDGERESVMRNLGIDNPMTDMTGVPDPNDLDAERGWSLWWRRMTADETETLDAGYAPWADGQGDPNAEARRLASSVRLASGLRECYWKIFHRGERKSEYVCYTNGDLPAFVEIEFANLNAEYANWMFEIGWAYGQPEDITIADGADTGDTTPGGTGTTGAGGTTNSGGAGNILRRTDRVEP